MSKLRESNLQMRFDVLSVVMKTVLVIPHSNADCERIFSIVRKNHTNFRPTLSCETLNSLVEKIYMAESGIAFYQQNYSQSLLAKAKSATYLALQRECLKYQC